MVWISILPHTPGRDINLPESVRHRSVEGDTLILVPNTSQEVTREEWDHIQSAHADLLPGIRVLSDGETKPAAEVESVAESSDG